MRRSPFLSCAVPRFGEPCWNGRLVVWRRGKTSADMRLDIERGIGLAIKETATESLRIVTWEPWRPNSDDSARRPVLYRRRQPPDDYAICWWDRAGLSSGQ
jgi:hypothetical protein